MRVSSGEHAGEVFNVTKKHLTLLSDETYQPTTNGLDQHQHAPLATSQPGHQASTHQAAVNKGVVVQAYAAAKLPEELPEGDPRCSYTSSYPPGTPGMYDVRVD